VPSRPRAGGPKGRRAEGALRALQGQGPRGPSGLRGTVRGARPSP
jgi:hypothetical protein